MNKYDEYFANKNEIEISGDFLNACRDLNIEKVKYLIENKNGLINKTSINQGLLELARSQDLNKDLNKDFNKTSCVKCIIEDKDSFKKIENYAIKVDQSMAFDNNKVCKIFINAFKKYIKEDEKTKIYIRSLELNNITMLIYFNEICNQSQMDLIKSELFLKINRKDKRSLDIFENYMFHGINFITLEDLKKMKLIKELSHLAGKIELFDKLNEKKEKKKVKLSEKVKI